ncbi:MAG: ferrous iron transport protein B [Gemmatimonadota bacterium]|nr:ferrous iron transport protein B [Gemmatimonadota bacterium]
MTTTLPPVPAAGPGCAGCAVPSRRENLVQLGVRQDKWDWLVALAGNPNTGKSTVFNALTGLRQHTGNWPGKTVARAEGVFALGEQRVKLVDLPGTYSLQAGSADEEVARDFVLFGQPDVTVVVLDATRVERNLNLALQILEITDRVVVVLNLIDEARRHGIGVDAARLSRRLGVPVIPAVARTGVGIPELLVAIRGVATGEIVNRPYRIERHAPEVERTLGALVPLIEAAYPSLPNSRWVALRLLNGDQRIEAAIRSGELGTLTDADHALVGAAGASAAVPTDTRAVQLLETTNQLRWQLPPGFHDAITADNFAAAETIAAESVLRGLGRARFDFDRKLDQLLTSRWFGFPLMLLILTVVFWLTVSGANVPSAMIGHLLIDQVNPWLKGVATSLGAPWWLSGFLFDGVYLATAWVISVMLPPMAIFFPLFTLLEDFGYLPRVAFNLDRLFRQAGAHGKQALTMCMGFGCNAAGVVATRVIDSPRERLVAIITNNFSLCNGRWPTQILIASIFLGALAPPALAGLASAGAVVGIAVLGIVVMFLSSWLLTRTVLRGEATTFSLELPPYRPPRVLQTLYTSLVDRTLIVLWRAVVFAAPAGAAIWLIGNVTFGGVSVAEHLVGWLNPMGLLLGLNGVILLAYVVAIPANEIVIPTVLMLTVLTARVAGVGAGDGVMFDLKSTEQVALLLRGAGWTALTGLNLMLFSLLHNPCSTTIYTIYKETGSVRWTVLATALPLGLGFIVCFLTAQLWRLFA